MTKQEYTEQLKKHSFTSFFRICLKLKISNIIIIDKGEKSIGRFNYKVRELNPYNPLTYLFVIICFIPFFIIVLIKNLHEISYELKKLFKYTEP